MVALQGGGGGAGLKTCVSVTVNRDGMDVGSGNVCVQKGYVVVTCTKLLPPVSAYA